MNVGTVLASAGFITPTTSVGVWTRISATVNAPAGITGLFARLIVENTTSGHSFRRAKLEEGVNAT